jgi:hypothetical protein
MGRKVLEGWASGVGSSAVALAAGPADELSHNVHLRCPKIQHPDCGITPDRGR